jgi:serine/threonine protein kinase
MIVEGAVVGGKYRILRPLGGGAMGKVYLAEKVTTHERFAVKFIHDYLVSDPTYHARFEREVNSLRGIRHPHVVAVYDWMLPERGKTGSAYIVMEYLTGESMQQALLRPDGMALEEVVRVMMQVLDGMAAVHALGIIHRDMSPANVILVGRPGGYRSAKILDFGLAKGEAAASSSDSEGGVTQDGTVLGRAAYAAPEMFLGHDLDQRADVFACGMIMYRALAGRFPYRESKTDLIWVERYTARHELGRPYVSARTFRSSIPAALDQIVSTAIRKRPQERYQSAVEMHQDLLKVEQLLALTPKLAPEEPESPEPAHDGTSTVASPPLEVIAADGRRSAGAAGTSVSEAVRFSTDANSSLGSQAMARARATTDWRGRFRRNPRTVQLTAGLLVLLGLLAVLVAILLRGGGDGPEATSAGTERTAADPADASAAADSGTAPLPSPTSEVTVTLVGLPDGAEATVGGVKTIDGAARVPAGTDPIPVKVTAPGYAAYETELFPFEDTLFMVAMEPLGTPEAGTAPDAGVPALAADTAADGPGDGATPIVVAPADAGATVVRTDVAAVRDATVAPRDAGAPPRDAGVSTTRRDAAAAPRDAGVSTTRRDADTTTTRRDTGGRPGLIIDY